MCSEIFVHKYKILKIEILNHNKQKQTIKSRWIKFLNVKDKTTHFQEDVRECFDLKVGKIFLKCESIYYLNLIYLSAL